LKPRLLFGLGVVLGMVCLRLEPDQIADVIAFLNCAAWQGVAG